MNRRSLQLMFSGLLALATPGVFGQNPIVRDQFSADPTVRVFRDKLYLYPSHDVLAQPGKGRAGWFCMEDYHVFSSSNLTDWKDHGTIVSQTTVPWTKPDAYSMWAPDCVERKGKYYFYFPAAPKEGNGFAIGVAVSKRPEGPFKPEPLPIQGVRGIDPNVFIDRDGQAYLYWSAGNIYGAKLKDNMVELAGAPVTLGELPTQGLKEGPFMFERNGLYYLTYPHVQDKTERLEYAVSKSPLGPFKVTGVIMDEKPGCWTNHHSILPYKGQWYLFYHHNDYSPEFDKARSVRADFLSFNPDGTIQKVVPTLRGVGITAAKSEIQVDRYSSISEAGASVDFLDPKDKFKGWRTRFDAAGAWARYDRVDFGRGGLKKLKIRVHSEKGGRLQVRTEGSEGPLLTEVELPRTGEWTVIDARVSKSPRGVQNLWLVAKDGTPIEVDWVRFE